MTVAVRVIPCLDVDGGRVVKGVKFTGLRDVADPVELAAFYDAEGADELTFLDITASSGGRDTMYDVVPRTAAQVVIPLTVGRGVRSGAGALAHFAHAVDAGADAVLAASVFHFVSLRIGQVKNALRGAGHPVRLQAVRERDLLGRHERGADLQLDLGVRVQRDVPRVALVDLPVVDGHHVPAGRAHLVRAQRLAPLVEEVTQGVGALDR